MGFFSFSSEQNLGKFLFTGLFTRILNSFVPFFDMVKNKKASKINTLLAFRWL